jgi:hypothetical protein
MTRTTFTAMAVAGFLLSPTPAAAQKAPHPLYEPSMADVGRWDAVAHYRLWHGRRGTARGRETNRIGCGGACVESKVEGILDVRRPGNPLRERVGFGSPPRGPDYAASGLIDVVTGSGPGEPGAWARHDWQWNQDLYGNPLRTRTVVERPDADRRVLTVFGEARDGREFVLLHVTYTRRK